jgi:hypothetical protein
MSKAIVAGVLVTLAFLLGGICGAVVERNKLQPSPDHPLIHIKLLDGTNYLCTPVRP